MTPQDMREIENYESFKQKCKELERFHRNGVRFQNYCVFEEGDGYQIQGYQYLDRKTGDVLARSCSRVEDGLGVGKTRYFLAASLLLDD